MTKMRRKCETENIHKVVAMAIKILWLEITAARDMGSEHDDQRRWQSASREAKKKG